MKENLQEIEWRKIVCCDRKKVKIMKIQNNRLTDMSLLFNEARSREGFFTILGGFSPLPPPL